MDLILTRWMNLLKERMAPYTEQYVNGEMSHDHFVEIMANMSASLTGHPIAATKLAAMTHYNMEQRGDLVRKPNMEVPRDV